ncbi:MAG: hypothetical protein ACXWRG_09480, partial [Bdellovibrio sp.]
PELIEKKMIQLHPDDKEKTEIKVVNYGAFTYVIINAFKEFYHKVAEHFDSQDRTIASIKLEAEQANNKAQKLEAENAVKDKEIESLKQENADIKARLERIEKMLH